MQHYNDPVSIDRPITLRRSDTFIVGEFAAMASPCEILIDTLDETLALQLTRLAVHETWRIEQKYSRYREDGIIPAINRSQGQPVTVDDETAMLIDFAFHCYQLSDGLFDITSGVLRRAWKFDGSDQVPGQQQIDALLPLVGLHRVSWNKPVLQMQPGMEIDLGGIGKEYAADRALQAMMEQSNIALLVNFGGDIAANHPRASGEPWHVGIELKDTEGQATQVLRISRGGVATSGDSRRFLLKDGKRYGHILNPKTGWPIPNPPRSVTVLANTCTEAGIVSTLAMLQGKHAERFLKQQGLPYEVQW